MHVSLYVDITINNAIEKTKVSRLPDPKILCGRTDNTHLSYAYQRSFTYLEVENRSKVKQDRVHGSD